MMKTKFSLVTLGAIALLAGWPAARAAESAKTPAQQEQRIQQMREQRMKQLDERLKLTSDQKARIAAIWDQAAEEGRAARQGEKALRRQLRKERREAMRDARQQVRSVLTPEQQKIFDEMRPAKPARAGGGA